MKYLDKLAEPRNRGLLYGLWLAGLCAAFYVLFNLNDAYFVAATAGLTGLVLTALNYKQLWYLGIFCVPLSLNLEDMGGFGASLPTDFIAILLTVILFLKARRHAPELETVLRHPVVAVVLLYFLWMLLTCFTSQMPVVSFKFFVSAAWFMGAYLVFSAVFFKEYAACWNWLWVLSLPVVFVVGLTMVKHAGAGFSFKSSFEIMQPFYKEHTAYAASIVIPTVAYLLLLFKGRFSFRTRLWLAICCGVLIAGLVSSHTRGAWLGLLGALALYGMVWLWRRRRTALFGLLAAAGMVVVLFLNNVSLDFSHKSDKGKSLQEHALSVVNTKTDLSNRERINRWVAAWGMIQERPILGFGPGTYAMQYAPYQRSAWKTWVSTNRGTFGTAHNEFLLAGSESGIPGAVLMLLVFAVSLFYAMRGMALARSPDLRLLYGVAMCGMATFYIHALVNNFLDQDKVAIPIYACMGLVVALDCFHRGKQDHPNKPSEHENDASAPQNPNPAAQDA